jgi:hypothetical protein
MSRTPSVVSSITAQQSVASYIDPSRIAQLVLQLAERSKENSELASTIQKQSEELAAVRLQLGEERRAVERLARDVEALPAALQRAEDYKEKMRAVKKLRREESVARDQQIASLTSALETLDAEMSQLRQRYRDDTGAMTVKLRTAEAELGELMTDHEQLKIKYELLHRRRDDDVRQVDRDKERLRIANQVPQGTQVEPLTSTKSLQTEETIVRSVGEQCEILVAVPAARGGAPSRKATRHVTDNEEAAEPLGSGGRAAASGRAKEPSSSYAFLQSSSHSLAGILRQLPHPVSNGLLNFQSGSSTRCCQNSCQNVQEEGTLDEGSKLLHHERDYRRDEDELSCLTAAVDNGELVHRYHVEQQIRVHDKLLAAVSSLQREAAKSSRVPFGTPAPPTA